MDSRKCIIYFRGKLYDDSLYNRIVANLLTFSYRLKQFFFIVFLVLVIPSLIFSCVSSSAKIGSTFYTDSLFVDSFGTNGHSYLRFRVPHSVEFQVLHNPDCYCRFNRTFIVIKKSK